MQLNIVDDKSTLPSRYLSRYEADLDLSRRMSSLGHSRVKQYGAVMILYGQLSSKLVTIDTHSAPGRTTMWETLDTHNSPGRTTTGNPRHP